MLNRTRKALDSARSELVAPLNTRVREINAQYKPALDALERREAEAKRLLADWREAERRRIAAERARVEAENRRREEEARAERDRELARVAAATAAAARDAGFSPSESAELVSLEQAAVPDVVPVVEAVPQEIATAARGSVGAVVGRMTWTFEVLDLALVPPKYLALNDVLVRSAVRDGVREIPGLRIYQEEVLAARKYFS
jgi:chromosome segregation ATPase